MTDIERQKVKKVCKPFLAEKFMFMNEKDEEWVLNYLASGKGVLPYQMVMSFDSLDIKLQGEFFGISGFGSQLKERDISEEEYQQVKKFFYCFETEDTRRPKQNL